MPIVFLDAGVYIAAVRGEEEVARRALELLDNPRVELASSRFLMLEVLPWARYQQRLDEVRFFEAIFGSILHWPESEEAVVERALRESAQHGIAAMDALHLAAALLVDAHEFVTTEKPTRPLYRAQGIRVRRL